MPGAVPAATSTSTYGMPSFIRPNRLAGSKQRMRLPQASTARPVTDEVAANCVLPFTPVPPLAMSSPNPNAIAWAGVERLRLGLTDGLDFKARPRWPLDPSAPPAQGAGVKA